MSKIQDAINTTRKQTLRGLRMPLNVRGTSSSSEQAETPIHLDGIGNLVLDPTQMERSCLLPFVKDKGAESSFMLLRTRLLKRMRDNNWKSLIVTGALPNEGKTTTAINLAIGISQDFGQVVVLVDLDLERPSIADSLGIKRTSGLSDYFNGEAAANEVMYNTDIDRLIILPNFEPIHSSETLVSSKMHALLDHIKQLHSNMIVIFDMSPVLNSDGVLAFAPHVDSLLFVVSEGHTKRALLRRANQMIEEIPKVGVVLNRSSEGNAGGYY